MAEFVRDALIRSDTVERRLYQENILKTAVTGNTLVVMPTALGKSFLGIVAIARVLNERGGKALFLAPTKPLATQHYENLKRVVSLPENEFVLLTGTIPASKRRALWENSRVISATPQTIQNDVRNGKISLENVSLLVVDECHHATKKYAYVPVAAKYLEQAQKPLILGLTASPSVEKMSELRQLLSIRHVESRTEQDADVVPYVHKKEITRVFVSLPAEFGEIRDLLKDLAKTLTQKLVEMGFAKKTWLSKRELLEIQQWLLKNKLYGGLFYSTALLKTMHAMEMLETQGATQLDAYFKKLATEKTRAAKFLLRQPKMQRAATLNALLCAAGAHHPKQEKLTEFVRSELAQNPKAQGLIFAHYRDSVQAISDALKSVPEARAVRFVGQASRKGDAGLSQDEQQEILQKFKRGEYNFLICTSVGEEGLDIPAVDLVLFYEPVPSEIRKVQREGRTGRVRAGRIIVFITKGTRDEAYYWSSMRKEKKMKETLRALRAPAEPQQTLGTW